MTIFHAIDAQHVWRSPTYSEVLEDQIDLNSLTDKVGQVIESKTFNKSTGKVHTFFAEVYAIPVGYELRYWREKNSGLDCAEGSYIINLKTEDVIWRASRRRCSAKN